MRSSLALLFLVAVSALSAPSCGGSSAFDPFAACPGCVIDGYCVADGDAHPESVCLTCDAAQKRDGWTAQVDRICDEDETDCSGRDTCDESGVCRPNHLREGEACGDAPAECERQDTCDGDGFCRDRGIADGETCRDGAGTCDKTICSCDEGYRGEGAECFNVDECAEGTHACHEDANCTDAPGTFDCECKDGFSGDGRHCTDDDECDLGTHECDPVATCENDVGGYRCLCPKGYDTNGTRCIEIDECAGPDHGCHANAKCSNTIGSHTCECRDGYTGDGAFCEDIDECAVNPSACEPREDCRNTVGEFECTCSTGYRRASAGSCEPVVLPRHIAASGWQDYARAGDTGTPCDGSEMGGPDACTHGGVMRKVVLPDRDSCAGVSGTDALGVLDWTCIVEGSQAWLVSNALATDKGLTDLIDFASFEWLDNAVTVRDATGPFLTTEAAKWWYTPVAQLPSGAPALATAGVYVAASDVQLTGPITVTADRVAIVVRPGSRVRAESGAEHAVYVTESNFVQIVGAFDAFEAMNGVTLDQTRFSTLEDVTVSSADEDGVWLNNSRAWTLNRVAASSNGTSGVLVGNSTDGFATDLTVNHNVSNGLLLKNSKRNRVMNLAAHRNAKGLRLDNSSDNTIVGASLTNSSDDGLSIYTGSTDNRFVELVAASNKNDGVYVATGASFNILHQCTTVLNDTSGVNTWSGAKNLFTSIATVNNETRGVLLDGTTGNRYVTIVSVTNGQADVELLNSSGTFSDLTAGTCLGATFTGCDQSIDPSATFVGKVHNGDTVNGSDAGGQASFPLNATTFDWSQFENAYRSWGMSGGSFPSATHRGAWTTGVGQIWDWSLRAADTLLRNAASTASAVESHRWGATRVDECQSLGGDWDGASCTSTYLLWARELMADGVGNENGLCESGEACVFAPNVGAYQGHGPLVSSSASTNGAVTGVQLYEFEANGD